MRTSTHFKRWTAAVLAFTVLATLITLAYLPVTRLRTLHQQALLYHVHIQALLELKHIAEMTHSAQRSYLLSHDPQHLQDRQTSLRQFSDGLAALSQLPIDNVAESALFGELTQQAAAWQVVLNAELQGFQAGAPASTALLEQSEQGMQQLDNSIAQLLRDEQSHDRTRIPEELEDQSRWTFASFIALLWVALSGFIWYTRRLQQEIDAHIAADRALHQANADLETRVLVRTRELQTEVALHAAAETRLQHANRALRVIAQANAVINHDHDEPSLLANVCQALVEDGGYRLCWVGMPVQDAAKSIRVVTVAGVPAGVIEANNLSWDETLSTGCPVGQAIRKGVPALVRDALNDPQFQPWRESARQLGFASILTLPLSLNDSIAPILCVYAQEPDAFDEDEVALLSQLGANLAHALNALRSQDALSKAKQQVSLLLESLPLVLYTCSAKGDYGFTYISPNVRQVTGYAHADLISKTAFWADHLHPDDRARVFDNLAGLFKQSKLAHEYRWQVADGNYRWFFDACTLVRHADGTPSHIVGVWLDITERKQGELALAVAQHELQTAFALISCKNELLQESNQSRAEFLAAVSHELKTPLNAIIGFSDLLLNGLAGTVNQEQCDFLRDIYEAGNRLLEQISALIDFAHMDAGHAKLDLSRLNAAVWLTECALPWRERAAAAGLSFVMELESPLGELWLDATKAHQIVTNLLSNAVKFTPPGGRITLSAQSVALPESVSWAQTDSGADNASATASTEESRYLQISVQDTGSGINAELLPKLFEPFHQGERGPDRRYSGVGLGLAMVRRLVELHGGKVEAANPVQGGACIIVWLPWREQGDSVLDEQRDPIGLLLV